MTNHNRNGDLSSCWLPLLIQVKALKELKKEDLITFFNRKIRRNGSERKKLSVHVFGSQHHRQLAIAKGEVTQNGLISQTNNVNGLDVTEWKLPDNSVQLSDKLGNNSLQSDQGLTMKMPMRIDNVQVFKRSQSFYCSPKVALWIWIEVSLSSPPWHAASTFVWWNIL